MSFFFAYPALLWGLAAGAIPLLLHLLRRRRARLQELPTLRFLSEAHRRRKFDIRFQDLLLLLLRTVLILLVVIALAGPKAVLSGRGRGLLDWLGQGDIQRVLLVDTSRSMGYREAGGTRLMSAVRGAEALLDELPASVETLVVGFSDGTPEEERALRASFSTDRDAWKQQLNLLQATDRPSRASWGLRRAAQLLADAADGGVFLLTDLQRSAWEDLLAARSRPGEFPFPISVVDVSTSVSRNIWLDRISLPPLPVGVGESAQLEVEMASMGYPSGAELPLRLTVADEGVAAATEALLAQRELLLRAGETLTLSLPFTPSRPEPFRALVEVESLDREEPLEADNKARVECPVLAPLDVLVLIEGEPPAGSVGKFDPEEVRFLCSCFRLGLETPGAKGTPPFLRARFLDPLIGEGTRFAPGGVVILYGPPALSPQEQSRLVRFVREGGAALVFIDPDWPVPGREASERLGWLEELGFGLTPIQERPAESTLRLRTLDHPALRLFAPGGRALFEGVELWRPLAVRHPAQHTLAEVRIASGTSEVGFAPVLGEIPLDAGRLMVCGVPLQRRASNLATSAAWVPLLQQLIKYLATPLAELPAPQVASLYPRESDLAKLNAAERRLLEDQLPIAFSSLDRLSEAIAQGQGSRDLTSVFLVLALLLALVEVFLSNRMR